MMPRLFYHVAPRWTAGSPALVDPVTAFKVADEEAQAYERYLTGAYGQSELERAEKYGLERIAYVTRDTGNLRHIFDLITRRHFRINMKKSQAHYYWYKGETHGVEVEVEPGVFVDVTKVPSSLGVLYTRELTRQES